MRFAPAPRPGFPPCALRQNRSSGEERQLVVCFHWRRIRQIIWAASVLHGNHYVPQQLVASHTALQVQIAVTEAFSAKLSLNLDTGAAMTKNRKPETSLLPRLALYMSVAA